MLLIMEGTESRCFFKWVDFRFHNTTAAAVGTVVIVTLVYCCNLLMEEVLMVHLQLQCQHQSRVLMQNLIGFSYY